MKVNVHIITKQGSFVYFDVDEIFAYEIPEEAGERKRMEFHWEKPKEAKP